MANAVAMIRACFRHQHAASTSTGPGGEPFSHACVSREAVSLANDWRRAGFNREGDVPEVLLPYPGVTAGQAFAGGP